MQALRFLQFQRLTISEKYPTTTKIRRVILQNKEHSTVNDNYSHLLF